MTSVKAVRNQSDSQLPIMGLARRLWMTICRLRLVGAVAEYYDDVIVYGEGRFDFNTYGFGCSL